jgi:ZIP family zinc transporter
LEYFGNLHPVVQALMAMLFTWGMTAHGSAVAFIKAEFSRKILDMIYGFAAGAMIFVVIEELIPESQRGGYADYATFDTLLGFGVMMILDVGFGS